MECSIWNQSLVSTPHFNLAEEITQSNSHIDIVVQEQNRQQWDE